MKILKFIGLNNHPVFVVSSEVSAMTSLRDPNLGKNYSRIYLKNTAEWIAVADNAEDVAKLLALAEGINIHKPQQNTSG